MKETKTVEHYEKIAQTKGKGILWHQLRTTFPEMDIKKFGALYKEILKRAGMDEKPTIDDYNILGV